MTFLQDEKAALFFSLAPASMVWRQLDTLSGERFQRILAAKLALPALSEAELKEARHISPLEVVQHEVGRDSQRVVLPGQRIEEKHLDRLPRSVLFSHLLGQLSSPARESVLKTFHSDLAEMLRGRLGQGWKFSQVARDKIARRCRFDPELFECFARSAAAGVAEWLLERLFFGVAPTARLCEISPLFGRPAIPGAGLRRRAHGGTSSNLTRHQQLAIVLMSLPPEVSAQLFKNLGPETVHAITLQISKLPPITPEARMEAIAEVTNLSPQELEVTARTETDHLSENLKRYLEEG